MDVLLVFEALVAFHGGLLVVFWMLGHRVARRPVAYFGKGNLELALAATGFGLMFVLCEIRFDPVWIDFTTFQLISSATYLLASVGLGALKPRS